MLIIEQICKIAQVSSWISKARLSTFFTQAIDTHWSVDVLDLFAKGKAAEKAKKAIAERAKETTDG